MVTEAPAEAVRGMLRDLIQKYGRSLADDASRLRGLLRDTVGQHRLEISLLVGAAEAGVASELARADGSTLLPARQRQLASRLESERGISSDNAAWAVETWAFALATPSTAPAPRVDGAAEAPPPAGTVTPAAATVGVPLAEPTETPSPPAERRPGPRSRRGVVVAAVAMALVIGGIALAVTRPWSGDGGETQGPVGGGAPAQIVAPDVVGNPEQEAKASLEEAGLTWDVTEEEASRGDAGTVLRQDPPAGASLAPGTEVTLVVAIEPVPVGKPASLKLQPTQTSVRLSWGKPRSGSPVARYVIWRDGKKIGERATSKRVFTDGSLAPGSTHRYKVVAIGKNGTKAETKIRRVTLPVPPPPSNQPVPNPPGGGAPNPPPSNPNPPPSCNLPLPEC